MLAFLGCSSALAWPRFSSIAGMIRQEVGESELENAIFAKATRDVIAKRLAEVQTKVAGHPCPGKTWEDDHKEVLASQHALVKATERAEYAWPS